MKSGKDTYRGDRQEKNRKRRERDEKKKTGKIGWTEVKKKEQDEERRM